MYRFMRNVNTYLNDVMNRLRSMLPLNASQLLWGLGAIAILLPATAYAWWRHNPVASSLAGDDQNGSSTSLQLHQSSAAPIDDKYKGASSHSSNAANDSRVNAQLHVNGHAVPLPSQGEVHKEIRTAGGKTIVDVSVDSHSSGTSQSNSSMNVEVHSSSQTGNDGVE